MSLTAPSMAARVGSRRGRARWPLAGWVEYVAMAILAFAPQLWAQPGVADSDTKSYLYLDPGRFLRQSASMWDPTVGLGTVTHEQLGFLFPLGPFFWAVHALGIPLWVGQRLWVGLMLFGAGSGVLYLCRTVGLEGPGRFVAAAAYMLSPYFLQDVGRIGTLILPWAGLGWFVAFVIRAVRGGGWRYPALFALLWFTVSGNNASGPIYAVVAPVLWLLYAVLVAKENTWSQAWSAVWRIAVLTAGVSFWWAWALAIESGYGLDILGVTEKVSAVAKTSLSSEVLRGLGYWFYYGADIAGPWAATSAGFTQQLWLIGMTFAVPVLALVAAVVIRWRQRAFFVLLIVVGMVLAVGSHPYGSPSTVGSVIKAFMTKTTAGLALRSTDRATPMVLLGLAVLLGAGVTAIAQRRRVLGLVATVLALATVAAANPPVWNGTSVLNRYTFPTPIPSSVTGAAHALNATHTQTRVLAIPGQNEAAYAFGNTVDPIWPGLLTRPFATNEQLPLGSLPTYDLLYSLSAPMQNLTFDPKSIAPLSRLMSVGDVVVQNNLDYALYDRPSPLLLRKALHLPLAGLAPPVGYGPPTPNVSRVPTVNELSLALPPNTAWPSPVEVLGVKNPRPVVRGESTVGALLVAGDGAGLASAAGLGLLDTTSPVLYAGMLDSHPNVLSSALAGGATLVVTDSNRKQPFLWNSVANNAGSTLAASDLRPKISLNIFPKAPPDAQTTAQIEGVASVRGVPSDPSNSPQLAIDGLSDTAWRTHGGVSPVNRWWQVTLTNRVTTGRVTILQASPGASPRPQWITRATLSFDGSAPTTVRLGPASRSGGGQVISFPRRTFTTLRITVDATNRSGGSRFKLAEGSAVGLAEVGVAGARAVNVIAMPQDLLAAAGRASPSHRLVFVMTRLRVSTLSESSDPEPVLARTFSLPTARAFRLTGTVRISSDAPDTLVDALLGRTGQGSGAIKAYSSQRLPGDPGATASAALDGDPTTMWSPNLGAPNQGGAWIQVNRPDPSSLDHLDLVVAADGHHSVPTKLRIQACDALGADSRCAPGSPARDLSLPPVADGRRQGTAVRIPVHFPALQGRDVTVTVTGVHLETTTDYLTQAPIALPLGIAELGIPGVRVAPPAARIPTPCRSDLISVDGRRVSVTVSGSSRDALEGNTLTLALCGADATGITLGAGDHVVLGAAGVTTGLNIDQLALDSAPGGGPAATSGNGGDPLTAPQPGPAPTVRVTSATATKLHVRISGVTRPYWLVLGQSINSGWKATIDGSGRDLGPATLVDGFANGWLIQPSGASTLSVTLRWAPQSLENVMVAVSALVVLACLALAVWPRRRRRRSGGNDVALADAGSAAQTDREGPVDTPVMVSPFADGRAVPPWMAGIVAAVCGLVAGVIVPPPGFLPTFVGVALGVTLALAVPRTRGLLGVVVVGFATGAVAYMIVLQATQRFPSGGWPVHFDAANVLVWTAIVFLGADAVVEVVRRLRR